MKMEWSIPRIEEIVSLSLHVICLLLCLRARILVKLFGLEWAICWGLFRLCLICLVCRDLTALCLGMIAESGDRSAIKQIVCDGILSTTAILCLFIGLRRLVRVLKKFQEALGETKIEELKIRTDSIYPERAR